MSKPEGWAWGVPHAVVVMVGEGVVKRSVQVQLNPRVTQIEDRKPRYHLQHSTSELCV